MPTECLIVQSYNAVKPKSPREQLINGWNKYLSKLLGEQCPTCRLHNIENKDQSVQKDDQEVQLEDNSTDIKYEDWDNEPSILKDNMMILTKKFTKRKNGNYPRSLLRAKHLSS